MEQPEPVRRQLRAVAKGRGDQNLGALLPLDRSVPHAQKISPCMNKFWGGIQRNQRIQRSRLCLEVARGPGLAVQKSSLKR